MNYDERKVVEGTSVSSVWYALKDFLIVTKMASS